MPLARCVISILRDLGLMNRTGRVITSSITPMANALAGELAIVLSERHINCRRDARTYQGWEGPLEPGK